MTAGRRAGNPATKQRILLVAQELFAQDGYDNTTIRAIAKQANVTPTLVIYFFKDKQRLFTEAILPIYEPMQKLPEIFADNPTAIPGRLAAFIATLLSEPQTTNMAVGLVRSAVVNEQAAQLLKENFFNMTHAAIVQNPDIKNPDQYINIITSQFIGIVTVRHILKLEPFASFSRDELEMQLQQIFQQPQIG